MPVRKGTLFMPSGGTDHLHVVMNDPVYDPIAGHELVLVASVTSIYPDRHYDPTCLLKVGDHPFVRHDSYISYRHAELLRVDGLSAKIASGEVSRSHPVSDALFQSILAGFGASDFVVKKVERFIRLHQLT